MCGIWGYNTTDYKSLDLHWVEQIIKKADERGGHSYGVYGITKNNKHIVLKQDGRANIKTIMKLLKNCVVAIGQSRLATSGNLDLVNTQPLLVKNMVIVHNGNILDYKKIMQNYNYNPVTNLDTEALVPIIKNNDLKNSNIVGSVLYLTLKEYSYTLEDYCYNLPLIKKTKNNNIYYCSKKWLETY
tara:strand:+ start:368 stop:925 length:558 start_codon:yes stop_codon:yes gene_type:complete